MGTPVSQSQLSDDHNTVVYEYIKPGRSYKPATIIARPELTVPPGDHRLARGRS